MNERMFLELELVQKVKDAAQQMEAERDGEVHLDALTQRLVTFHCNDLVVFPEGRAVLEYGRTHIPDCGSCLELNREIRSY